MKKNQKYPQINVAKALALIPLWIKEKDTKSQKQKKFAEKLFGPVIKYIEEQQKIK